MQREILKKSETMTEKERGSRVGWGSVEGLVKEIYKKMQSEGQVRNT